MKKGLGIAVTVAALMAMALPAPAGAAIFESFEGTLTKATINPSWTRITFEGSITPTQCESSFRAESCEFSYRVTARPAVKAYRCVPGRWESAEPDPEEQILLSQSASAGAGATQPFAETSSVYQSELWPEAGFRLCLQVLRSNRRPNKECAEYFDPSLCAEETVYSYVTLATLRPTIKGVPADDEGEGGRDPIPRAKNCKPVLSSQPKILVYRMSCGKARQVVRKAYEKHERANSPSWRLRALGFSCHRDLTNSRPLICRQGQKRLESALP